MSDDLKQAVENFAFAVHELGGEENDTELQTTAILMMEQADKQEGAKRKG